MATNAWEVIRKVTQRKIMLKLLCTKKGTVTRKTDNISCSDTLKQVGDYSKLKPLVANMGKIHKTRSGEIFSKLRKNENVFTVYKNKIERVLVQKAHIQLLSNEFELEIKDMNSNAKKTKLLTKV